VIKPPRILFVTADMGAGHREGTAELVRRCAEGGAVCETVDLVRDAGPAGHRLRRSYQRLLASAPWLYDTAMRFWARWPAPLEAFTALNAGPFERTLRAAAARFVPDLVVSNFNLASQCLGRLAHRGELHAPVVTLVPDAGAHPYWVSRHVTAHLVPTELTAKRLAAMGAKGVRVVQPVLRPEFRDPPVRAVARDRLQLPQDRRIVLLTAGSWAVGGLPATVRAVRQVPDLLTVVLCGRDEELRSALAALPDVIPLGWTSAVADHLAAADVVVDNAGGLTCWEALACRTPVALFNPLVGHGRVNVATLDELGLATWARTRGDLVTLLSDPSRVAPARLPAGDPADEVVLGFAAGA
jgi:UDP-N-acetylglucosamine:LPS N-acetylglucosamine transferase